MAHLFDITYLITTFGYTGIFTIVFLESGIFFALPGDSLLFTAGLFASAYGLNIFMLVLVIFLSTLLGGMAGYEIGKYLIKLRKFSFFQKILKQEHMDKAHEFFEQHGVFAVVFSRFVPIIRTFVPIVAGAVRMNYAAFVKYSIVSSILWSSVVTLLGYFLGQAFPVVKDYLWLIVVLVILTSLLPLIFGWMRGQKNS